MSQLKPLGAGVGLKPAHFEQALSCGQSGLWYEVHSENYMISGGPRLKSLLKIRDRYPVSLHGVGASLGGPGPLDQEHLKKVRDLVELCQPAIVSEHAVWSRMGAQYFAELLPLPRTREFMDRLVDGIDQYQEAIRRPILIENPTNYLPFKCDMDEAEFLVEVCRRSGSGFLLDVNNLYLSGRNCGVDCKTYLHALPKGLVGEIHIAGYSCDPKYGDSLLIDSHASPVSDSVWDLLKYSLELLGPVPVLLERDDNIPSFEELLSERDYAAELLGARRCENAND